MYEATGSIWETAQLWRNGCLVSGAGGEGWLYVHQGGFHGSQEHVAAACAPATAPRKVSVQPRTLVLEDHFPLGLPGNVSTKIHQ